MTLSDAILHATWEKKNYLILPLGEAEAKAYGNAAVEVHYAHGVVERWNPKTAAYEPWTPSPEELASDGWLVLASIPPKGDPCP